MIPNAAEGKETGVGGLDVGGQVNPIDSAVPPVAGAGWGLVIVGGCRGFTQIQLLKGSAEGGVAHIAIGVDEKDGALASLVAGGDELGEVRCEDFPGAFFGALESSESSPLLIVHSTEFMAGRIAGAAGANGAGACAVLALKKHPAPVAHSGWVLAFVLHLGGGDVARKEDRASTLFRAVDAGTAVALVVGGLHPQCAIRFEQFLGLGVPGDTLPLGVDFAPSVNAGFGVPDEIFDKLNVAGVTWPQAGASQGAAH